MRENVKRRAPVGVCEQERVSSFFQDGSAVRCFFLWGSRPAPLNAAQNRFTSSQRRGVCPTEACERLLPLFRRLLQDADSCAQLSASIRGLEVGTVTIGTAYSAFYAPLARLIAAFHARYPGISVRLHGGYSTELLKGLYDRELDFCLISRREGEHEWLPVCRDQLMAWLPAAHPLAALEAVPVSAFAREPYIETYPDKDIDNSRAFARCGVRPNLQFATMDSLATYSMVEAGLGLSMNNAINGRAFSGSVRMLPLDPPQTVELGVAVGRELSPAAEVFRKELQAAIPALAKVQEQEK